MTMKSLAPGVSDHHFYMIAMVYNLSHSYSRYYSLRLMALVLVTRFYVQEYPSSHDDRGS